MSDFRKVKLVSKSGGERIEGELVVDIKTHWQVAVDGKVRAFSKGEFIEVPSFDGFGSSPFGGSDIFNDLFGKRG